VETPDLPISRAFSLTEGDLAWKPIGEGVEAARLLRDPARDFNVILIRYLPGGAARRHVHPAGEQFYIVRGTIEDETGTYRAGTFINHPPGSVHTPVSPEGAVVLCTFFGRLEEV
jgi:anti-sigma factor ChrR (cupin superfamily)